jgi:hypothetical protein
VAAGILVTMATSAPAPKSSAKLPKSDDLPSMSQSAFHLERKSLDDGQIRPHGAGGTLSGVDLCDNAGLRDLMDDGA